MKRGYSQKDNIEFGDKSLHTLKKAGGDLFYLLNQGYKVKGAVEFVGNHYLLSQRQRQALQRSIYSKENLINREQKEIYSDLENREVHIDGFNTIITLETALSGGLLIRGMDGAIRDLAGVRGNYRLLDITETAIQLLGEQLTHLKIKKATFYLDAPVSNSGRLKLKILELLSTHKFEVQVEVINNVDSILENFENVVTSDAIILDKCQSWINMNSRILDRQLSSIKSLDFGFLMKF